MSNSNVSLNSYNIFQPPDLLKKNIEKMTRDKSGAFKRRDFVAPLLDFCLDNCYNGKIGIVYGLRSTGKTVGMLHAAESLIEQGNNVTYAAFQYKDDELGIRTVTEEMKTLAQKGVTHFFLDEVTYLGGFINLVSEWPDRLVPERGIKIIISGADSFLLWVAQCSSLFHRYVKFNANWSSYSEYVRVTENSYDTFKREGGIFSTEKMHSIIQSAVVDNLLHSLDHLIASRITAYADTLYGIHKDTVYKSVISILKCAVENSIRDHFIDRVHKKNIPDLGSALSDLYTIDKRDIKEKVADSVIVYKSNRSAIDVEPKMVIEALIEFLVNIECLVESKMGMCDTGKSTKIFVFNHNAFMNYAIEEIVDGILQLSDINQPKFIAGIRQAAEGVLNENIVLAHVIHGAKRGDTIFKYRDGSAKEIDIAVVNRDFNTAKLIEVKSKTWTNPRRVFTGDAKNLFATSILKNIGIDKGFAITQVLAYMGKTKILSSNGKRLLLVNIELLLTHYRDLDEFFGQLNAHADAALSKENLGWDGDGIVEVEYV
ncbi:MAG: AAA family ATPase [Clostridiales bacterium]|jgi:predicted AAA+ superfamily ATPase|nr:AAA family ATPase [Clostridiales bacterium]